MSDEKALYWLTQVIGWFLFVLLILFQNLLTGPVDVGIIRFLALNFFIGLSLSHLMRFAILHLDMLKMKVYRVLPRVVILSLTAASIAAIILGFFQELLNEENSALEISYTLLLELVVPFTMVFLVWNVLYFAAIYLKNYEREEVKNLRLTSSMTEVELNNLRSQLNPHFMFNALNSIRALVDENPAQAKISITQMSNILRSSLASGKQKFVTLEEEMRVVKDYLELEKIRFEERLEFVFDIPASLYQIQIPPLLIQTLVENAVKHGISNLPSGGKIEVKADNPKDDFLELFVNNTGEYNPGKRKAATSTGIGLANSRRRLSLLYGDKSSIEISNKDQTVVCKICIPVQFKNRTDENPDN